MLTIFKKFFAKSEPKAVPRLAPGRALQPAEPAPMPSVAVAHLSLAAIIARFPEELRATVLQAPNAAATVALPLPLIHKQLATGSVRMSLASLHRQAPAGVFAPIAAGDKRQVEIPLQEIFRHVNPQALKRRPDQRPLDTPENDFNLFGNSENPYEIAPTTPENPARKDSTVLSFKPGPPDNGGFPATPSASEGQRDSIAPPSGMRVLAPPPDIPGAKVSAPAPSPAPVRKSDAPSLTLPLAGLVDSWPAEICGEITALDQETTVRLDSGAVAAGLAKGKVVFTWGEIRAGLEPQPSEPTSAYEGTALQLPLRLVAPAFLAASKKEKPERKSVEIDDSIPALFSDAREPAPAAVTAPTAEEAPAEPVPVEAAPILAPIPVAAPLAFAAEPEPQAPARTVGELFGVRDQLEFTPAEIVAGTVKLPGVSGAIIALQEGLQVATSLPEGIKSEVVAAFLPQIFARLNQYSGEMKLGEVDDLLFTTHGAHCQIYRLGIIYFAVLGHPGAALPWHELRLIATELSRQTQS